VNPGGAGPIAITLLSNRSKRTWSRKLLNLFEAWGQEEAAEAICNHLANNPNTMQYSELIIAMLDMGMTDASIKKALETAQRMGPDEEKAVYINLKTALSGNPDALARVECLRPAADNEGGFFGKRKKSDRQGNGKFWD